MSEPCRTPGVLPARDVGRPQLAHPRLERVQKQPVMTTDVTPVRHRKACRAVALPRGSFMLLHALGKHSLLGPQVLSAINEAVGSCLLQGS